MKSPTAIRPSKLRFARLLCLVVFFLSLAAFVVTSVRYVMYTGKSVSFGIVSGAFFVVRVPPGPFVSGIWVIRSRDAIRQSDFIWWPQTIGSGAGLAIPIWIPALLSAGGSLFFHYRITRVPKGHCRFCGYNLTGNTTGQCPECGNAALLSFAEEDRGRTA